MKTIPIISLWQPWASLVAWDEKHIETRSWKYRGGLPCVMAIHAAKKWSRDLAAMCEDEPFASAIDRHVQDERDMPFGAIVGVVRLVECVATNFIPIVRGGDFSFPGMSCLAAKYLMNFPNERAFGDYSVGRYAWAFDQRLFLEEPIPMVGHQGIWQWNDPPADVVQWCEIAMKIEIVNT